MATTPANWISSDGPLDRQLAMLSSDMRASKVRVVDARRAVLEMLQIRLDVAGYHPLAARTGTSGLEILRNMKPAALVLDSAVVEMGAFEVLSHIQGDPARFACPILLAGKKVGCRRRTARRDFRGADLYGQTLQRRGRSRTDRQASQANQAQRAGRRSRNPRGAGISPARIHALCADVRGS